MKVKDVMTRDLFVIGDWNKLLDAKRIMGWAKIRHVPVVGKDGRLKGIVTLRDILSASVTSRAGLADLDSDRYLADIYLSRVMSRDVKTVGPEETLHSASDLILKNRIGCLPVIESDGRLTGIITEGDFVHLAIQLPSSLEVSAAMSTELWTVESSSNLLFVDEVMKWARIRHVPYVDPNGNLLGIISHRDLLSMSLSSLLECKGSARDRFMRNVKMSDCARKDVVTISPSEPLGSAALLMERNQIGAVVVVEGRKLKGIVTQADLVRQWRGHEISGYAGRQSEDSPQERPFPAAGPVSARLQVT